MEYRIDEDELFQLIRKVYLKGMHGQESAEAVAEEIVRSLRGEIVAEPEPVVPCGHHWEVIMTPNGDMMTADDCETYIQEMGVPPPIIVGPGPVGPDTPWCDINGTFYRRKHEPGRKTDR